ncbi:RNA polymerase sigma factor [uncultured Alsobacter sp.]|uniref:RNA polymerase sigma factor n=1 Tax=uncultured Alsobacter sp. TaxID=1748258 RepID=UPI0025D15F42|nr:RNA polymerase sigma factor [uncultured Alsobacter sp.]
MTVDPDDELVQAIGRGDPRALRTLVESKLPRVMALARRMLGNRADAEDVAQEACLRIWRQATSWRRGTARFDTWVHRVVLNLCYDRLRRPSRTRPVTDADLATLTSEGPGEGDAGEQRRVRVEEALQALPPRQREAIVLVYYQELSNIEAARTMEVSVDALESLLARGRRALQAVLTKDPAHG